MERPWTRSSTVKRHPDSGHRWMWRPIPSASGACARSITGKARDCLVPKRSDVFLFVLAWRGSVVEHAEVGADVVGPQDDGQNTSPKAEVKVAEGEEPCGAPSCSHECVLLDADLAAFLQLSFSKIPSLMSPPSSDAERCACLPRRRRRSQNLIPNAAMVLLKPERDAR